MYSRACELRTSQDTTFEQLTCEDCFLHHFGLSADLRLQSGGFIDTISGSDPVRIFLADLDKSYPNYIAKNPEDGLDR